MEYAPDFFKFSGGTLLKEITRVKPLSKNYIDDLKNKDKDKQPATSSSILQDSKFKQMMRAEPLTNKYLQNIRRRERNQLVSMRTSTIQLSDFVAS